MKYTILPHQKTCFPSLTSRKTTARFLKRSLEDLENCFISSTTGAAVMAAKRINTDKMRDERREHGRLERDGTFLGRGSHEEHERSNGRKNGLFTTTVRGAKANGNG